MCSVSSNTGLNFNIRPNDRTPSVAAVHRRSSPHSSLTPVIVEANPPTATDALHRRHRRHRRHRCHRQPTGRPTIPGGLPPFSTDRLSRPIVSWETCLSQNDLRRRDCCPSCTTHTDVTEKPRGTAAVPDSESPRGEPDGCGTPIENYGSSTP